LNGTFIGSLMAKLLKTISLYALMFFFHVELQTTLSVCGVDYSLTSRTRWRWPFWRRLDDRRAFEIVRIRPQMAEMTPYLRLMKSRDVIHTYANRFIASVPTRVTCSLSRKFGPGGTHGHDVPYLILPRARRAPTLPLDPTGGKALRPPYRLALPRSP